MLSKNDIIRNLNESDILVDRFILDAPVSLKIKLLGLMFPQKIEFDGNKYRTNEYNKVLDLIYQQTNELRVGKKENGESFSTFSVSVPRPVILIFKTDSNQTIITN